LINLIFVSKLFKVGVKMHTHIDDVPAKEISPGVVERILLRADQSKPGGLSVKHHVLTKGGQVVFEDPLTEYQHYIVQGCAAQGGPNGDLIHQESALFVPGNENAKNILAHAGEGEVRILTMSYRLPRSAFRWAKSRTKNLFQVPQYHSSRQVVGYTQIFTEGEHATKGALMMHGLAVQTCTAGIMVPDHRNPEEILYVLKGEGEVLSEPDTHKVRAGSLVYTLEGDLRGIRNTHEMLPLQYVIAQFVDRDKM